MSMASLRLNDVAMEVGIARSLPRSSARAAAVRPGVTAGRAGARKLSSSVRRARALWKRLVRSLCIALR
ncbi:MAG: hypothetical protein ABI193_25030, partial [Minicystis sp.]